MNIFVTGANGFIGSTITRRLSADGHKVTGLVRPGSDAGAAEAAGASIIRGDLLEPDTWKSTAARMDLIISASSPVRMGEVLSLPDARRRSYLHGQMTGNLFLAAQGSKVRAIALNYGILGYGDTGEKAADEFSDLDPKGYERSITGAYWHIDKTSRKTKVPLINVFSGWAYGPGGWFGRSLDAMREGSFRLAGDGGNHMSFIHIDDVSEAWSIIAAKVPTGSRLCLTDEHPVTQKSFFGYAAKLIGCPPPRGIDPDAYAQALGELAAESMTCSTRVSSERTTRMLGLKLRYPDWREGLAQVIDGMGLMMKEEKAA
ncbi:MAG: NAD-dependent epimerase/dehydratase family protein [Nitrospirae bacterium]|nr:NAD-dependent epimerase/dehydratase family protein [Nitrospirota bacterium]